ncbi:phosphate-starvation-inducible PsiE family protein [Phaeovibrio sulfidiphilus]|uniref:Phosphate-starvation-inducible PsiE family protein n=1 Tax=Phaeovibrio sulfidiphilus TaxID=1220600 RepID=A0A8J7CC25_9PROT|nr:phosphate-starvation-inducible PsiE family protein [Phaeovibrio sulfidiphilus]MBE1236813.1 phosphate-starvation-inducible PsiE family protein [Phaeovibrio sulfidiphilus]
MLTDFSRNPILSLRETLLEFVLVRGLWLFNGLLHIVISVALVVASVVVLVQFFAEMYVAFGRITETGFQELNLVRSFLHALGVLFIVWTLSALISAEVEYVRTGQFQVRVFLEVAMITLLRQLIVMPVQTAAGDVHLEEMMGIWGYLLVLGAILVVAIAHRLVGGATTTLFLPETSPRREPPADPPPEGAAEDAAASDAWADARRASHQGGVVR